MPREILFRGKRVDNEEWVYGSFVSHEDIIVTPEGGYDRFEIVPDSVGQWIGEVDKNEKKIFHNDIIEMDSWKPKYAAVGFIEGAFCLVNKRGEFLGDIHYIHHAGREQATVVGNLMDNSHLLK